MAHLNLAPDFQEEILFLPALSLSNGPKTLRDPVCAREVIALAVAVVYWGRQREGWRELSARAADKKAPVRAVEPESTRPTGADGGLLGFAPQGD